MNSEKEILKKEWKSTVIFTITSQELTEYIKVAARSNSSGGGCWWLSSDLR